MAELVNISSPSGKQWAWTCRIDRRLPRSPVHSPDGTTYTTVAIGTWIDDASLKTTTFTPFSARYVKVQALSEAGGRGQWTSAAEFNVYTAATAPPSPAGKGKWVLTIDFPLVPVSLAHEATSGQILAWSSYTPSSFGGSPGTTTYTATFDPATQLVTQAIVTNTNHDMFCEGLSIDFNGKDTAAGGNTDEATSEFNPKTKAWTKLTVSDSCSLLPVHSPDALANFIFF